MLSRDPRQQPIIPHQPLPGNNRGAEEWFIEKKTNPGLAKGAGAHISTKEIVVKDRKASHVGGKHHLGHWPLCRPNSGQKADKTDPSRSPPRMQCLRLWPARGRSDSAAATRAPVVRLKAFSRSLYWMSPSHQASRERTECPNLESRAYHMGFWPALFNFWSSKASNRSSTLIARNRKRCKLQTKTQTQV